MGKDLQHNTPVWRHKANFIIGAKILDPTYARHYSHEQLWVKKKSPEQYELCCIPFALYDLFLGDIVTVDNNLILKNVIQRSGHLGFRVLTVDKETQLSIAKQLRDLGCLVETFSDTLLAVDAEDEISAQEVANLLAISEKIHLIKQFETIKTK